MILLPPEVNRDARGSLDVVYSRQWPGVGAMEQWNVVRSRAGVLRGMHAHSRYGEIYAPVLGRMLIVLKDARRRSPTFGVTVSKWIGNADDSKNLAIVVPVGVAHAVFFASEGILAYGLSSPWTGRNEFNCLWNDPEIGHAWPEPSPLLSPRDAAAGSWAAMVTALDADLANRPECPP